MGAVKTIGLHRLYKKAPRLAGCGRGVVVVVVESASCRFLHWDFIDAGLMASTLEFSGEELVHDE